MSRTNTKADTSIHGATLRPKHIADASSSTRKLIFRWLITVRWHLLLLFTSELGRRIITSKYDAFTTDNAYDTDASGRFVVGPAIDWIVRRKDTHVALRQRLAIVAGEMVTAATIAHETRAAPVRLLSGPCGLARDMRLAWISLESAGLDPGSWLEVVGLDLDATGTVLEEASRLATDAGVPLHTHQRDLLESGTQHPEKAPIDIFVSMGLTTWLADEELHSFLRSIRASMATDGFLLIDNWRLHKGSRYVRAFELPARYPSDVDFESALVDAGFEIEAKTPSANGVVVVYRARPQAPDHE